MSEKISVKPDTMYLEDLMVDISEGKYKIPIFQRDFVWKPNQMIELFDSILKGYPIGSLLFWKPIEEYVTKDEVGPYLVDSTSREMSYVLDGFQRISTLFGVLTNPKQYDTNIENNEVREFVLYFNSKENSFQKVKYFREKNVFVIPVFQIYDNRELFNLLREIDREEDINEFERNRCIDNIRNLHDTLHKYRLPFVQISGGDIKSAVDIFSRINSEGTKISEDFLLSALSYNNSSGFLLADAITDVLDSFSKYNFSELKRDTIFNCIVNSSGKLYFDIKLEELKEPKKFNLEDLTNKAMPHIKRTVEFLYHELKVVDYRYLPYPTQFIFISEYFRLNPSVEDFEKLKKWFWITTYSNYFTLYSLSQQRNAYYAFCSSINDENISVYKVNENDSFASLKFPKKLDFTGVRQKALQLFLINQISCGEISFNEGIVEQYIFSLKKNRTRTPSNILIRLSSEFETSDGNKSVKSFISNSSSETLSKYFISEQMKNIYLNIINLEYTNNANSAFIEAEIDKFIALREFEIIRHEYTFIKELGIEISGD